MVAGPPDFREELDVARHRVGIPECRERGTMGAVSLAGFHLGFRLLSSGELHAVDNHLEAFSTRYVERETDPSCGEGERNVSIQTGQ